MQAQRHHGLLARDEAAEGEGVGAGVGEEEQEVERAGHIKAQIKNCYYRQPPASLPTTLQETLPTYCPPKNARLLLFMAKLF